MRNFQFGHLIQNTCFKEYEDKIITHKFEDFTQYQLVFKHKNLLPKDIRKLLSKCYDKYYLRYSWIKKIYYKNINLIKFQ